MKIELSPFLLQQPRPEREIVSLLIAHPTPPEEQRLGQLFMVIRVSPSSETTRALVEMLEREGRALYYQQLESNVELAFESMLKKLNELLSDFLEYSSAEWLDDFHAVIGVIKGQDLFFAHVGRLYVLLVHHQRILNVLETAKGVETRINPLKIFSQTISGQLFENDTLIVGTTSILDYLSLDRLRAVAQSTAPSQAALALENLLAPNVAATGFGALLIRLAPETIRQTSDFSAMQTGGYTTSTSQSSMDQLVSREHQTRDLLSPSLWSQAWKYLSGAIERIKLVFSSLGLRPRAGRRQPSQTIQYYTSMRESWKPARRTEYPSRFLYVVGTLLSGLQLIFSALGKALRFLISLISGRRNLKQRLEHLPANATTAASKRIIMFQRLTRQRKIILIVAILVIFIFAQSVIWISQRGEKQKQQDTYVNALTQARVKQEEAEAALLYGDEDNARNLLKQAEDSIGQIPAKTQEKKYKSEIAGFRTKIEALYTRTKHINQIDPKEVAKVTLESDDSSLGGLLGFAGESIVSYSGQKPNVYQTSLEEAKTTAVSYKETGEKSVLLSVQTSARFGLLMLSDNSLVQYDLQTNALASVPIEYENQDRTIVSYSVYADRLYCLDVKNNQIFRHVKAGQGFTKGKSWLTDGSDVTNGVSVVVDGSVYVLRSNGELSKFFQGKLDASFGLKPIEPALERPAKVWTAEGVDYFYILDPGQKRLLVYTKKGRLKNQYVSDKFDQLKDMVILPKDKKAYVLNGTTVYQIDLLE